jgi:FixJ family two-component response regulator
VLLDIWMPDVDGITLLKEWAGAGLLTMPVIMMSGHGTIDTAVEATQASAPSAFLEKPITLQKLLRGGGAGPCSRAGACRAAPAAARAASRGRRPACGRAAARHGRRP